MPARKPTPKPRTPRLPQPASELEALLLLHIKVAGLPTPEQQVRFHPTRRWRFDFAFRAAMVAVEVDGATWTGGRHTRGAGFQADCEKLNEAALAGWLVLRFTRGMIESGAALAMVQRALKMRSTTTQAIA